MAVVILEWQLQCSRLSEQLVSVMTSFCWVW